MRSWKRNWVIFLSRFKHGFEIDKYNVHWSLLWYLDLCLAKPFLDLHDFPQRSHGMEIPVMWFASMWSLIWFLSTHFTYSYSSLAFVGLGLGLTVARMMHCTPSEDCSLDSNHHNPTINFMALEICSISPQRRLILTEEYQQVLIYFMSTVWTLKILQLITINQFCNNI